MKIKTKTIKLSYPWTGQFKEPGYRIEQLTNSTEFHEIAKQNGRINAHG